MYISNNIIYLLKNQHIICYNSLNYTTMEVTMKVLGLITEYNPFHFGHKHHLEASKKALKATHTLAIMSGSFVQRGEPSIVDKWTKARMAIDNGIDLVIELPFVYAVQSAELFALGAIKVLDSLNLVDYISFGSEVGDLTPLQKLADILLEEPKVFKETLRDCLNEGLSFSVSRSRALESVYSSLFPTYNDSISSIVKKSNNILGIEYLKAIKKLNSNIRPYTISRIGHDYNDTTIDHRISSATGIRKKIHEDGIDSIESLVPKPTFYHLSNFYKEYGELNSLKSYSRIVDYLLITKSVRDFKNIFDMEDGLENRFVKYNEKTNGIIDLIQGVSTKRYPKTRIQRILIHLLLGLTRPHIENIYSQENSYIRVLGSNHRGLELLKQIKKNSNIHILSKFADYKYLNNENINLILDYEKKASDLFFYGINSKKYNMDYLISPYIK